jgi:hypothetical protein
MRINSRFRRQGIKVGIRGTPFVVAIVMSAAALLLMPDDISEPRKAPPEPPPAAAGALPANLPQDLATTQQPPPVQAVRPAPAGTARTLRTAQVNLNVTGFWSWALLDRRTGALTGSTNAAARSDTASMIKAWLAADYLRGAGPDVEDNRLRALSTMIRDSNNDIADSYYKANGGSASINRMIRTCGLTESRPVASGSWSTTEVSARDGARLGACLADGRAAGPTWTSWLLTEMRAVRGAGRFGIVNAFAPDVAAKVAIKNGWINRNDGKWHVACLAVTDEWAMTVLTQYPVSLGLAYGANVCKQVAVQLGTTA